jgi:hypothetical protein
MTLPLTPDFNQVIETKIADRTVLTVLAPGWFGSPG